MSAKARAQFAAEAKKMCDQHDDIHLHAIVVKKENVEEHIRKDANKLYNYMIRLCLLDRMCSYDSVTLVPDPRSIKVRSGSSLHDYLQTELWFAKKVRTDLFTCPADSKNSLGVQFADMLAGVVQARYEDNALADFRMVYPKLNLNCLFFGQ